MSVPIKTQIGENYLAYDGFHTTCEDAMDEDLKKKNGFVTNVKIKVNFFGPKKSQF